MVPYSEDSYNIMYLKYNSKRWWLLKWSRYMRPSTTLEKKLQIPANVERCDIPYFKMILTIILRPTYYQLREIMPPARPSAKCSQCRTSGLAVAGVPRKCLLVGTSMRAMVGDLYNTRKAKTLDKYWRLSGLISGELRDLRNTTIKINKSTTLNPQDLTRNNCKPESLVTWRLMLQRVGVFIYFNPRFGHPVLTTRHTGKS